MANTPNIRFQGFTDDWEQRKFGDDNDLLTGYPFESEKYVEEGINLVRGMNVKRGFLDLSDDICVKWNSSEGIENYLLKDGDILIQMDGALIGKSYARISENQLPALLVQRVTRARTQKGKASADFMYQTIQRDFLTYIKMNKTETAVPHLSLNDIRDFKIMVPKLAEQVKIGEYFRNLDNLITLHQRKRAEMKKMKKFMLQKMFPKNGAKKPEIRFDGFTDDWEQRKFSDLCDMVTVGIANSATHAYSDSGIVMFRNQNIKPNFLDDNDIIHINPEFEVKYKNKRLKKNDLLVARTGYPGTACVVPEKYENSQTFTTLIARPKNSVNPYFLCQYLNSDIGVKYFESTQIGGGQKNSGAGILNEMPVMLPFVVEEESKIADYFRNLDHLITLHQRKAENLKNLKKYMLQNMFV